MEVTGFAELERQLLQLKRSTSKGVARRAMKKSMKPVLDTAEALWPGDTDAFQMSSRISRSQPRPPSGPSVVNMHVGSAVPHAHLVEFGTAPRYHKGGRYTGSVAPNPVLQTAWDINKAAMLSRLKKELGEEIRRSIERARKRAG
ncbi:MAG: HK97 gp10 family phage protein [Pseudomonadales bacterium]|nr:HK97 gp10 family phage protein [Pseudomonadales bacterium]